LLVGNVIKETGLSDTESSLENLLAGGAVFSSDSVREMVSLSIAAFERGDYLTALERAESARSLLMLERKGDIGLFLYLYWHFVLIGVVLLLILVILLNKYYQKVRIVRKIEDIDKEEGNIGVLIKELQTEHFGGKISAGKYDKRLEQHQKKLVNIRKKRINLRNKRIKLLAPDDLDDLSYPFLEKL